MALSAPGTCRATPPSCSLMKKGGGSALHYLTEGIHAALQWLFAATGNYGWAILLLTVILRGALLPLNFWSQRATARSAVMQAEVKEIQTKYQGDEQQKRLQEVYSRSGGAMLAGCLPMLMQMPVFLAMYSALNTFPYVAATGFLWLESMAMPDPYFILPLLVVGTQLWQSLISLPKEQRLTAFILPVVMGFILFKASAAISIYWVVSNLISVAQSYAFKRPRVA